MAPGKMTDRTLNGGMVIGALNYSFMKNFQLYLEGGYKNWKNSAETDNDNNDGKKNDNEKRHLGMRNVFLDFNNSDINVTAGLQEMKLGDFIMLDERTTGIAYKENFGAITINVVTGSVLKNFARMGHFCSNRHLYNLMGNNFTENIGKKMGETNLTGTSVTWNTNYTKEENGNDDDEFSEFDETTESTENNFAITNIGFLAYNEFGKIINDNKYYFGTFTNLSLIKNIELKLETVLQSMKDQNSIAGIAKIHKSFLRKSGDNIDIELSYFGKYAIDDNAIFQPLFSNIFAGEVMRLDAVDFPFVVATLQHKFPWKHLSLKLNFVKQLEDNEVFETDFITGISLFNHSKISLILSHIDSNAFDNVNMARIEAKVAF